MRKRVILIISRILLVALLAAFVVVLVTKEKDSTTPIETMAQAVTEGRDLSGLEEGSNRLFKKYYKLDAGDYDGIYYMRPKSNMNAEEILIIKLKNNDQKDAVLNAVNEWSEAKKSTFEGYAPEQYDLAADCVIKAKGNYVIYIVHKDAAQMDAEFEKAY